jgi:hypothetical protein
MSEPVRISLHTVKEVVVSRTNYPITASGQPFATTEIRAANLDGTEMQITLFHGIEETPLETAVGLFQTRIE